MWQNARDIYLEDQILSADPVELVHLLYQASATAVEDARRHLAERDIRARARSISKACDILMELATSLDRERGGEMAERLAQLYGYMHTRLVDANTQQNEEGLIEVGRLLTTLQEGWEGVRQQRRRPVESAGSWMPAATPELEMAHASGSWSF